MKLIIIYLIAILCFCNKTPYNEKSDSFFSGNHELLALNSLVKITEKSTTTASSAFFIVVGGFNFTQENSKSENRIVHFVWKNNKEEYIISELPMSKVRFQFISDSTKPYCKFKWRFSSYFSDDEWYNYILYVVFVIKESQICKTDIKLNLN